MDQLFGISNMRRTITVGGESSDITGFDSDSIQLAADALKTAGGGTIELSAGVFLLFGPVRLHSNIRLVGQGDKTLLRKADGFSSTFADDVDYGVNCARVKDPSGFKPGMGILIKDSANGSAWVTSTSKILKVTGDTIWFDRLTLMDYTMVDGGTVSTASSMIEVIKAENVFISNIVLDGNKDKNFRMDSCMGGGVYFHKAGNCTLENAVVRDYNGDGVNWQVTEGISLENVEVSGCTGLGLHPGTGAVHASVRNCSLHHNDVDGLYVCWRVQQSTFIGNAFYANGSSGISIGHKDSGNLFEHNYIHSNGKAGILIRYEEAHNSANDNTYRNNTIENNGVGQQGCGILIESAVKGNTIQNNTIRNTDGGNQAVGIVSLCGFESITILDNEMSGHTKDNFATEL